ncbi:Signal transduction histidine kinase [Clostridium acidisoli DSM 12555]|uniref:histidine kinase n=1 Tax=Clostridium acidisoli DSM 12555 TaxID=1121291 RepID=A0A1W1XRL4_9CLOT|nr:HAMP domain-containing sensor histidine kinase [Clostridium acidisoli]SMC26495.1 Signal transduction histidine kinase [Clostridium acidisoli DSM 12555]
MKKSIRFKMFIVLIMMFIFFIATLLFSFSIFYRYDFRYNVANEQVRYGDIVSMLAQKSSKCKDEKSIERVLSTYATNKMQVELLDENGKVLWSSGNLPAMIKISAKDYVITGGVVRYGIRINGILMPRFELLKEYSTRYLWIVLSLLFLIFLLIALFLHLSITKPIFELCKRMGNNPIKLKLEKKDYREDEIGILEKGFDDMIIRLKDVDRQQQTMLAAISHDLKTPLTSIITYTERLALGKVIDIQRQQHYYKVIMSKANDIRNLIDKFQEAAMIVALQDDADYKIVCAKEFWQSIFEPYMEEWEDVDAKIEYVCKLNSEDFLKVDSASIKRVIENVISNAVKYGDKPLVVHTIIESLGDKIHIRIENNGTEVPKENLPYIFDRFYRVEPSRSRKKGGSGLGLFICREIIEKHAGSISAYKPEDNGFGIEIIMPKYKY